MNKINNFDNLSKFSRYMSAFTTTCPDHRSGFRIDCSECWAELHRYKMSFGGYGTEAYNAVLAAVNFASTADGRVWRPFMAVGRIDTHTGRHDLGWCRELYAERKAKHNAYYGIKEG